MRTILHVFATALNRAAHGGHILVYPKIHERDVLADVLNRVFCALRGASGPSSTITIPVSKELASSFSLQNLVPPSSHHCYLDDRRIAEQLRIVDPDHPKSLTPPKADVVLVWSTDALFRAELIPLWPKVVLVDPGFYLAYEPYNYAQLQFQLKSSSTLEAERNSDREKYKHFFRRFGEARTCYLFATGPSLTSVGMQSIGQDALKIACNSIVKSEELLRSLKPDVFVFSDPVFHFGVSKYAESFRAAVRNAMGMLPESVIVVPEEFAAFTRGHVPHPDRIIGIPHRRTRNFNFPTPDRFYTRIVPNIMTGLMLPLAAASPRTILIAGADGRQKGENYYWRHNPQVQFGDLMESAFSAHPSFTRDRVYEDYYEKHCRELENLIEQAEGSGSQVFALTQSFIPALQARPWHSKASV